MESIKKCSQNRADPFIHILAPSVWYIFWYIWANWKCNAPHLHRCVKWKIETGGEINCTRVWMECACCYCHYSVYLLDLDWFECVNTYISHKSKMEYTNVSSFVLNVWADAYCTHSQCNRKFTTTHLQLDNWMFRYTPSSKSTSKRQFRCIEIEQILCWNFIRKRKNFVTSNESFYFRAHSKWKLKSRINRNELTHVPAKKNNKINLKTHHNHKTFEYPTAILVIWKIAPNIRLQAVANVHLHK